MSLNNVLPGAVFWAMCEEYANMSDKEKEDMYYQECIEGLQAGKTLLHRGKGNSMTPLIKSGQLQTIVPIKDHTTLKKGDAVFCKVGIYVFTHKIKGIKQEEGKLQFLIGNNHGKVNGWTPASKVYGKCVKVED